MDLLNSNIIKYISSAWLRFENAKQWILQVKCPPSPHKGVASPRWQVLSAQWSRLVLSSSYHLCKDLQCLVSSFLYFVILLTPHHLAHHQQAKAPTCLHLLGVICWHLAPSRPSQPFVNCLSGYLTPRCLFGILTKYSYYFGILLLAYYFGILWDKALQKKKHRKVHRTLHTVSFYDDILYKTRTLFFTRVFAKHQDFTCVFASTRISPVFLQAPGFHPCFCKAPGFHPCFCKHQDFTCVSASTMYVFKPNLTLQTYLVPE